MVDQSEVERMRHHHVFLGEGHAENARRTMLVAILTGVMMVGEVIAGTLFNSMALLADGFHMATHAGALAIAAGAYAFARHYAASRRFTFGTGKVGDLAGFASALILGVVALGIAVESIGRLIDPREVAFTEATVVAAIGLAVNLISALLLRRGRHFAGHDEHHHDVHHHAAGHGDNNLRAAFVHVLADALTSVLAIVALLSGRYLGWAWLDPVIGIVGAFVIASWSWALLRDTAAVLLDEVDLKLEAAVRERVESSPDAHITDLHLWRVAPGAHAAILSVTGGIDRETVRARLAPIHGLAHVTIELR